MKAKIVGCMTAFFAGAGIALAQTPASSSYHVIDRPLPPNLTQASATEPESQPAPGARPTLTLAPVPATESAPAPAPAGDNHLAQGSFGGGCAEPCNRFWVSTEYLVWWTKSQFVPTLAATAPAAFANTTIPESQQTTLFGGTHLDFQAYSGVRFTMGYFLDDEGSVGIDANYFTTETRVKRF